MKIILIAYKHPHHGSHSGYDRITEYFPGNTVINIAGMLPVRVFSSLSGFLKRYINYERRYWNLVELLVTFRCRFLRNSVVHILYPESFSPAKKRFPNSVKLGGTFHLPLDEYMRLNPVLREKHRFFDQAIVMSGDMKPWLEEIIGKGKVSFIPHGIDTGFFKPLAGTIRKDRILVVGGWLRDFALAGRVFRIIHDKDPEILFTVVAQPAHKKFFSGQSYVEYVSGIPDGQLLALYQTSKILYLPLKACTANNALLEGAACGCRIYVSTSAPDYSYFSPEQIRFSASEDPEKIAQDLLSEIKEFQERQQAGLVGFVRENYSWEVVASRTCEALIQTLVP